MEECKEEYREEGREEEQTGLRRCVGMGLHGIVIALMDGCQLGLQSGQR
jgi:hypothetical protein